MSEQFTCYVIGDGSLLLKCSEILLECGHKIYGIISSNPNIKNWATRNNINALELNKNLTSHLYSKSFDYLFSIANFSIMPDDIINSPRKCAINFHDGPLPKYAGMHVTSWAIMNQEKAHGITWHEMSSEVDRGDILKQAVFEIVENETSLSLNTKCFESGFLSFRDLVDELVNSTINPIRQNFGDRTYFGKYKRPDRAAIINWNCSAESISALVRALDFGRYANPLGLPKVKVGSEYFIAKKIKVTDIQSIDVPGVITSINEKQIRVSTKTNEIEIKKGLSIDGDPFSIDEMIKRYSLKIGFKLDDLDDESAEEVTNRNSLIANREEYWVKQLMSLESIDLHYAKKNIALGKISDFKIERICFSKEVLDFFKKINLKLQANMASAFGIFVGRHSGKNDYNIGYSDKELKVIIGEHGGLFSEYVPLRITFDTDTSFMNAVTNLASTFNRTVENKTYPRDLWGRYPELYQNIKGGGIYPPAVIISLSENIEEYEAQLGCVLTLVVSSDLKSCGFVFDSCAITEDYIKLFKTQFLSFLEEVAVNSEKDVAGITILSAKERNRLFVEWNKTKVDFLVTKCMHQLFEEQVEKTPGATAVVCRGKSLTYRELNERSNQVAHSLQKQGVEPETLVGAYLHRSLDMVIAVMGALKAGGAYVPLDPSFPEDRISYMIEDSKCSIILTDKEVRYEWDSIDAKIITVDTDWNKISREKASNFDSGVTSDNLAYVIYTSGSTGKPKGVMVEHRNVVNLFTGMDNCIGSDLGGTWLAATSLSFDISIVEIFWTLARGFRVIIYAGNDSSQVSVSDKHSISELINFHNVTHFQCTPSMASMLIIDEEVKRSFGQLRQLLIGGETFPASLAAQLQVLVSGDVINMYGPTETTVWSTTYNLNNDKQIIPIGRPIANTKIYILDNNHQPMPVGVPGELFIGGAGVARGYLNKPELTAERFIRNPFDGNKKGCLYHTGDLACYLPDGNIEFMGRMDNQVKIRGYRIELGEIETVINEHPYVSESVVIVREDFPVGKKKLVAYIIPREGKNHLLDKLREYVKEKLPGFMVPAYFITLKTFPRTLNKKIDRNALPLPEQGHLKQRTDFDPPRTDIEEAVAGIWAEALGIQQVSRSDNFFDIGGDSLSACGVILSIRQTCNVELPLKTMFHEPSVAGLAERLEGVFQQQEKSDYIYRASQETSMSEDHFESPCTPVEKALASIWKKILRIDRVNRNDHYFQLGGKSLDAVKLFAEIEKEFGKILPLSTLLQAPTLVQLAEVLQDDTRVPDWSPIVPIQPNGSKIPFFCVHAHRGNVLNYYPLAQYLGPEQPFYGIQSRGLDGLEIGFYTIEDMAADYLKEIRTVQPRGPYVIGGYCLGGLIALEIAHLLKEAGDEVALLVLIDTPHPGYPEFIPGATIFHKLAYNLIEKVDFELNVIRALDKGEIGSHLWKKVKMLISHIQASVEQLIEVLFGKLRLKAFHSQAYKLHRLYDMHNKAYEEYNPYLFNGKVALFRSSKQPLGINADSTLGWGELLTGELKLREIPGHYINLFVEPSVRFLAEELKNYLYKIGN